MSDDALQVAVQRLADAEALRTGLGTFARLVDGKQWSEMSQVFADDVTFDYGDQGHQSGLPGLVDTFRRYLDICGATQHFIGSIKVDVRDDGTAETRAYVQARHQGMGALAAETFDTNGEYIDAWVRRPEGWRIVNRVSRWFTTSGNAAVLFPR
jgi:3-phenylpropionate/cinnamic acid dioxygenase small subunit